MNKVLANLSIRQRITIVVMAVAVSAGLYALVQHQREADFRPLFTGIAPEDAAGIVQKLKESGVEYRLPEGGGSVLVPSARLAEVRLSMAAIGLPKSGRIGFGLFDKVNLGATEFTEHINYRRALRFTLSKSSKPMRPDFGSPMAAILSRTSARRAEGTRTEPPPSGRRYSTPLSLSFWTIPAASSGAIPVNKGRKS